jgi:hypothetical protein
MEVRSRPIIKGVGRAMAGEYSREFSAKAFNSKSRLIELGFRQGGLATSAVENEPPDGRPRRTGR